MSKLSYDNHRFPYAPGLSLLMTLCAIPATMSLSQAQGAEKGVGCGVGCLEGEAEEQTPNSPTIQPPNPLFPPSLNQPPKNAAPPLPNGPTTQSPGSPTSPLPNLPTFTITYLGEMKSQADGTISAEGVEVNYAGIVLSADKLEGNINRELIFSGHAKITTGNSTAYADTIHFFPKDRSYRLDNPRGVLSPELLQNRLIDPVFVRGGELLGNRDGYTLAEHCLATTCIEEHPHYQLRIGSAELFPHKRLILKRVTVVM